MAIEKVIERCPVCRTKLRVAADLAATKPIRCPQCGEVFRSQQLARPTGSSSADEQPGGAQTDLEQFFEPLPTERHAVPRVSPPASPQPKSLDAFFDEPPVARQSFDPFADDDDAPGPSPLGPSGSSAFDAPPYAEPVAPALAPPAPSAPIPPAVPLTEPATDIPTAQPIGQPSSAAPAAEPVAQPAAVPMQQPAPVRRPRSTPEQWIREADRAADWFGGLAFVIYLPYLGLFGIVAVVLFARGIDSTEALLEQHPGLAVAIAAILAPVGVVIHVGLMWAALQAVRGKYPTAGEAFGAGITQSLFTLPPIAFIVSLWLTIFVGLRLVSETLAVFLTLFIYFYTLMRFALFWFLIVDGERNPAVVLARSWELTAGQTGPMLRALVRGAFRPFRASGAFPLLLLAAIYNNLRRELKKSRVSTTETNPPLYGGPDGPF